MDRSLQVNADTFYFEQSNYQNRDKYSELIPGHRLRSVCHWRQARAIHYADLRQRRDASQIGTVADTKLSRLPT